MIILSHINHANGANQLNVQNFFLEKSVKIYGGFHGLQSCRGGGPGCIRSAFCSNRHGNRGTSLSESDHGTEGWSKQIKSRQTGPILLLFILLAAYCHNQCTRCLLVYAVNFDPGNLLRTKEYINVALNFNPAQYAWMVSYGFTLLYAISSLFAGLVADRLDRVKTLCAAISVWSLALAAQGTICQNFASVFLCRVVQGLAMAFTGPQCLSLLTDYFPPASRATALSMYTSGVYLGGALGSLSIISNARWGWRRTFVAWAGVGLAITGLVFGFAKDPKTKAVRASTHTEADPRGPVTAPAAAVRAAGVKAGRVVADVVRSVARVAEPRAVKLMLLATAFRFCAGYSIGCWSSPYFRARFPAHQPVFGLVNAAIVAGCGSLSALLGGVLCDRLCGALRRRGGDVKMLVSMAGCLLAIPAWALSVRADRFWPAMAFLALETFLAECWMGPTLSVLAEEAPREVRGMSQGMIAVLTMVGNAAPLAIGVLERSFPLQSLLVAGVSASYAVAALFFFLTARALRAQELAAAAPPPRPQN